MKRQLKLFLGVLALLGLVNLAHGAAHNWMGRVIPVSFDRGQGQWNLLLGLENGRWVDFRRPPARSGQQGAEVAASALRNQTNNVYNVNLQGTPWRKLANGDIIHFAKVQFICGRNLYNSARNQWRTDFAWIPINSFLNTQPGSLQHGRNNYAVETNTHTIIRDLWPQIVQQLGQAQNVQAGHIGVPQVPRSVNEQDSWFGIQKGVYFYNSGQPYYEFTNFYAAPIQLDGQRWPTTEHYFQAQKFPRDRNIQNQIRSTTSPRDAFNIAQRNRNLVRNDWQQVNTEIMIKAVTAKVNQHAAIQNMLLNTGDRIIIENAGANDAWWGAGADGTGQNMLGRVLMYVRSKLRNESEQKAREWLTAPISYLKD